MPSLTNDHGANIQLILKQTIKMERYLSISKITENISRNPSTYNAAEKEHILAELKALLVLDKRKKRHETALIVVVICTLFISIVAMVVAITQRN